MSDITIASRGPGVAVVTIDRPARRNACNLAAWRDLATCFGELGTDRSVRLVILTGAKGHFCAGADISEFSSLRADREAGAKYEEEVETCYAAIEALPRLTIAAIEGVCVGGGCALAMCCDFRIAADGARFGIPAAKLGAVYTTHECKLLISLVGFVEAKRILYGADLIDAATAERVGLIDEVCTRDVVERSIAFADGMTANAPLSIAGAKLTLQAIERGELEMHAAAIDAIAAKALGSEDYKEGVRAFMEKRQPRFVGR